MIHFIHKYAKTSTFFLVLVSPDGVPFAKCCTCECTFRVEILKIFSQRDVKVYRKTRCAHSYVNNQGHLHDDVTRCV